MTWCLFLCITFELRFFFPLLCLFSFSPFNSLSTYFYAGVASCDHKEHRTFLHFMLQFRISNWCDHIVFSLSLSLISPSHSRRLLVSGLSHFLRVLWVVSVRYLWLQFSLIACNMGHFKFFFYSLLSSIHSMWSVDGFATIKTIFPFISASIPKCTLMTSKLTR